MALMGGTSPVPRRELPSDLFVTSLRLAADFAREMKLFRTRFPDTALHVCKHWGGWAFPAAAASVFLLISGISLSLGFVRSSV